jgi:hypothetical protein
MRMVGFHFAFLPSCAVFLVGWLIPIILGFTFVRADADRHGQPGWLWAVLTIPFGWLVILIYAIIRATSGAGV